MLLIIALLAVIQYNIFLGYGIHDVGIIAWPAIIFFVGLFFGSRSIPYITILIMCLALVTKIMPNAYQFNGYADTGDLIVMMLVLVSFSLIGISIIRSNERSSTALGESEQRYRDLFENSSFGLYRTTPDGRFLLANPVMVRMMGFSSFDELAKYKLDLDGFVPGCLRSNFLELIELNGEVKGLESAWVRQDGTTIFTSESAHLTRDQHGKTLYYDGLIEDISQRKRLEEAFTESDTKYRRMVETTNEGVIALDLETRITLVNQQAAAMLGYKIEELLGQKLEALLFEEDIRDHQAQMELRTLGQNTEYERCFRRKDGSRLWTIISATATRDPAGRLDGAFGMLTDITERKRAENALRSSEEKFKKAFSMNPSAIVLARTRDNRVIEINEPFSQIFGYSSQEILDATTFEKELWVEPHDRERLLNDASNGLPLRNIELQFYTKDKRILTCSASFESLEIEGEQHILAVLDDITERKLAREKLLKSEALFRAVVEHNHEGIILMTAERRPFYVSPSYTQINGYLPEEWIGGYGPDYVHPDDQAIAANTIREVLQAPGRVGKASYRLRHKLGHWFWVETTVTNLLHDPAIQALVLNSRDITERRQSEKALRESEQRYRELFKHANLAIFQNTMSGKIQAVNPEFARMFGYSDPEDVLASIKNAAEAFADPARRDEIIRLKAEQPDLSTFESLYRRKDGSTFLGRLNVREVTNATISEPFFEGFIEDITERRQAEDALRESEEHYRGAITAAGLVPYVIDYKTRRFSFIGENILKLTGYTAGQITPAILSESILENRAWGLENSKLTIATAQNKFLADESENWGIDIRIRTRDGAERWLSDVSVPLRDKSGVVTQAIGVLQDMTERKQREKELETISHLSGSLREAPTRADMLPAILKQLVELNNCDAISIEMIDPLTGETVVEAAQGTWADLTGTRQAAGTGLNSIIAASQQPYHNNRMVDDPHFGMPLRFLNGIQAGAGVPLIAQNHLIGYLWVGRKNEISESEVRLLAAVADIAANAIYRATLFEQNEKHVEDLTLAYDTTLDGWAHALELRDQETEGHTRRVTQMTVELAIKMGIPESELENVRRGALLHDIGKMAIPDSVLLKPGTLNEREWEIMRRHPEYAFEFLEPIEYLHQAIDIPYCHHEKWDGSGYPRGLQGEQIPFVARIFAIVDVWDALRSNRPYRAAWSNEKTRNYILAQNQKHFDPQVLPVFLEMLKEKKTPGFD